MLEYAVDGAGVLEIRHRGTEVSDGVRRDRWEFTGITDGGDRFRSWGTAPVYWSHMEVFMLGCECVGAEVERSTGDVTGNAWMSAAAEVAERVG